MNVTSVTDRETIISDQAILILAHKNIDQVLKLSEYLLTQFNVYIHLDTKVRLTSEQAERFQTLNNNYHTPGETNIFRYFSSYDVKWGSFSIVQATILLMRLALKDTQNMQFHLISGQDWPLKPLKDIYDFYQGNNVTYIDYYQTLSKVKSHEPEIWWVKYYFNYDQINRRTLFGKIYHRVLLLLQTIFRVNKLKKTDWSEQKMYAGQEWIDIPRDALEYALKKFDNDTELQHIFATSFCSDEMWLQTILCNSKKYRYKLEKNIHRFIPVVTKNGHGETPAVLTEKYYSAITSSSAFWGRKFVSPESDSLMTKLQRENES